MSKKAINIVCFGDSITQAAEVAPGERWPVLLELKLNAQYPGRFRVHNQGVGGNTSAQGVDRLAGCVIPLLPGIVLAQFGFNDCHMPIGRIYPRVGLVEFERKLREIHGMAAAYKSRTVFIVNHLERSLTPQADGRSYSAGYRPYEKVIRRVARALRAPMIDLPVMMRRRKIPVGTFVIKGDGIHLSPLGNRLYADMVCESLIAQRVIP
jgi:lysophospholipase L1-like esterase